jgi:O-antigen/teichoic acid export membrane protein
LSAAAPKENEQHQDVSHAARSGLVQTLTIAGQALLTVTQVLLARLFGREVFGSYQASLAVLEMLTRSGTGGADKGMLRFVAGHRARGEEALVRSALGTGLRLCLLIAGSTAVLLMLFARPIAALAREPAMTTALRVMAPAAVLTGAVWVLVQASLAARVTRANFIVRGIGEPILFLLAGVAAAGFGRSLVHLGVAHVLAAGATLALAVAVVGRVFGRGEIARSLWSPWLPGFARFSIPLGAAELLNTVMQRADIVILTVFLGPNATAVYAASEFITRVISNTRYVFDSIAAGVFSESLHLGQRERLRQNLVLMSRWVATLAAPIAITVVVLRRELLALYGPGFRDGAAALTVLAIGHFVNATLGLSGWILVTSGRSRLSLLNNVAAASVNVVAGLTLIPRFGPVGTAIASLGSIALLQIAAVVEVRIIEGVSPLDRSLLKPLAAGAVAFLAEAAVSRHVAATAARVVLVIAVGLCAYGGALATLGLAPEDRQVLARARARVFKRT